MIISEYWNCGLVRRALRSNAARLHSLFPEQAPGHKNRNALLIGASLHTPRPGAAPLLTDPAVTMLERRGAPAPSHQHQDIWSSAQAQSVSTCARVEHARKKKVKQGIGSETAHDILIRLV